MIELQLFNKLYEDQDYLDYFCQLLEDIVFDRKNSKVNISYRKTTNSIYFFLDGFSILEVMPNQDLHYTYTNIPLYQNQIEYTISVIQKQYIREAKISEIIRKER